MESSGGQLMDPATVNFDNLLPALVSCFGIIFLGYLSGRLNFIAESELKGMNTFVRVFVLPSLIFVNMVKMDLATVNWSFLLAILIAKGAIFVAVITTYFLLFGFAGIAAGGLIAIFCTQSNDFALGYPIVEALYQKTHPDFASYMYLLAPVNLAILNPIAFFLMETTTFSEQMAQIRNCYRVQNVHTQRLIYFAKVLKKVYTNPIIFMTLLGILANVICKQSLPPYIDKILTTLGQAFSACALFALGLRMVGKLKSLSGGKLITPCLLILAKLLVLPLLVREIVNALHVGASPSESLDWSTFGFLYGTIPSAPTIFVFAVAYNLEINLVATSMVACTFVSGPWMFISAKMIALTNIEPTQYMQQLTEYISDLSIASLCASGWVILVFALTKRVRKVPHKFVMFLITSQMLSCIGAILYRYVDMTQPAASYIQYFLFTIGNYSSRIWTAIIAVTLLFMESRSLCFILFKMQPLFYILGWILPAVLAAFVCALEAHKTVPDQDRNPNFVYGTSQAVLAVFLLVLCSIVSAGCLVLYEMRKRHREAEEALLTSASNNSNTIHEQFKNEREERPEGALQSDDEDVDVELLDDREANQTTSRILLNRNVDDCCNQTAMPTILERAPMYSQSSQIVDIEDLFAGERNSASSRSGVNGHAKSRKRNAGSVDCPSGMTCTANMGEQCQGIIMQYQDPIDEDLDLIEDDPTDHDPQILRHFVLIIVLLSSMLVGLAVAVWTLVMEQTSGIYVELSFLDASLNFGQGIVVLVIFGIDNKYVLVPLLKKVRKLWYRDVKLVLPMDDELSAETKHICAQFTKYHLDKCVRDIAQTQIYRLREYHQVFSGKRLVDWLLAVGLVGDRTTGVNYARHLVEGRVLRHINCIYHFYDRNLLFTFN